MFKKKKRNDKGSTLIMVIVALGFIGIMVSLILIISSNNIYTKLVDKKSKNNFYSVENVLDQVEKGIQSSMSRHMVKAYYKVLSEYNNQEASTYSEKFKKLTMEGIPGDTTAKGFKQEMCEGESFVKVSSITAYLDDELKDLVASTDTANCLVIKGSDSDLEGQISFTYDEDQYQFIIENFRIQLTREEYFNDITTDLVITVPDANFVYNNGSTLSDEFKRYCLISSELNINSNCEVNIRGNIWAGDGGVNIKDGLTKCKVECDSMYAGGGLNITDCFNKTSTGVTNFKISMLAGSKSDSLYPYLAAKKIVVDSTTPASNDTDNNNTNLDVSAACIVGDDLVLESPYSTASFTGTYSGVGSGATSFGNSRSSIILNGKYSSLDMQLEALLLAGQACVNGSMINNMTDTELGLNYDSTNLNDVVTGESVSVRGNQAAYLIPVEYLPFSGNPVLIDEYNTVIYNYAGSSNAERLTNLKNEIVNNITAAKPDIAAHLAETNKIATYFYKPYGTTQLVYFYYNFSEAGAKLYFQENYMNGATDMINQFASLIPIKSVNINSVVYNVMGNFITRADSSSQEVRAATGDAGGADNARRRYNNLKAFFSTSTSAVTNSDGTPYDYNSASALNYLIKWENIQKTPVESTNVIDSTIDGYRVLVVDNKGFAAVEVPNGFCGIVIATGDVKVATGNVKGLFVAQGKLTLSANTNIEADTTVINAILRNADSYEAPETTTYKVEGEPITLKDVFANYNASSAIEEVGSFVSMEKMIGYANWRKN